MFGSTPPPLAVEEELRQSERLYQQMAHVDYLTGLPNRCSFMEQAELEFTRTSRYGHQIGNGVRNLIIGTPSKQVVV
jgi:GGDEF domain-containing protein